MRLNCGRGLGSDIEYEVSKDQHGVKKCGLGNAKSVAVRARRVGGGARAQKLYPSLGLGAVRVFGTSKVKGTEKVAVGQSRLGF